MKVKFLPNNVEYEIQPSQSLLELAQEKGLFIKSVCNGVPNCAECRIQIVEGEHNIFPPSKKELALIGTAHFIDRRRLACQVRCFGDVTISLEEQVEKQQTEGQKKRQKAGVRVDEDRSHALSGDLLEQNTHILESVENITDKDLEREDIIDSQALALSQSEKRKSKGHSERSSSQGTQQGKRRNSRNQSKNKKRNSRNKKNNASENTSQKKHSSQEGRVGSSQRSKKRNHRGNKSHKDKGQSKV